MTPTARSLAYLRAKGYTAGVVERWIAPARRRIDLGGFGDIVAWAPDGGILAIQATSDDTGGNTGVRIRKILELPEAALWLASGGRIIVHGWARRGKRRFWTLTVENEITLADFKKVGCKPSVSDASHLGSC